MKSAKINSTLTVGEVETLIEVVSRYGNVKEIKMGYSSPEEVGERDRALSSLKKMKKDYFETIRGIDERNNVWRVA